jgi:FOG: EAL domain
MFAVEGLETAAELQYVTNHYQVDLIQGYYTGRPELLVAES